MIDLFRKILTSIACKCWYENHILIIFLLVSESGCDMELYMGLSRQNYRYAIISLAHAKCAFYPSYAALLNMLNPFKTSLKCFASLTAILRSSDLQILSQVKMVCGLIPKVCETHRTQTSITSYCNNVYSDHRSSITSRQGFWFSYFRSEKFWSLTGTSKIQNLIINSIN